MKAKILLPVPDRSALQIGKVSPDQKKKKKKKKSFSVALQVI